MSSQKQKQSVVKSQYSRPTLQTVFAARAGKTSNLLKQDIKTVVDGNFSSSQKKQASVRLSVSSQKQKQSEVKSHSSRPTLQTVFVARPGEISNYLKWDISVVVDGDFPFRNRNRPV